MPIPKFSCWAALLALIGTRAVAQATDPPAATPDAPAQTVIVTGRKLAVETLIDRRVYTVTSDLQASFGSLADVLTAIPSVDVDPDGNVSLRGDSNVLILIDGKPSTQFSGSAAGDNLQSISAKDIERIEVITTPPAQFKADGAAGVINIITRKKHPDGTSGSVQGSLGDDGRSVGGANLNYHSGPLTATATAGIRRDYRQRMLDSTVLAPDPTTGQLVNSTSSLNERIHRQTPTAGLSAEYALDERQSLSGSMSWTQHGGHRTYTQTDASTAASGTVTNSTDRLSSGHDPQTDWEERLGYTHKLAREGEQLDFSLHRSTSHQLEVYDYTNDSFIPPEARYYNNLSFLENQAITDAGVDYDLPFSKTRSLKVGYSFEQDDYSFANAGNNLDVATGGQIPDPNLTNDFTFRQQINSGYASFQAGVGAWNVLAGLRAELTHTDAQQITSQVSTSGSYFQVYPSLHVDRSLSDETTLSLGASRRVSRPDPEQLNPYIDYEYAPNLSAGNVNLRPQYTQSYEVGYGYEGAGLAYQLTGYYRRNRDSVTNVTEYIGNGDSLTTLANLPKNDSAGMEITSNGHIVPTLGYAVSANFFYSQIDATALGTPGLQSTVGVNGKLTLDYRPTAADSAQLIVTRTDKRLTPQGYISAINIVNIGYKRQLKSDLTAILTVSDVLNGQRYQRVDDTPMITATYLRAVRGRVIYVGLIYSFGITKKGTPTDFQYDQPG
ncbi:MAG TPA: TonB-dependent receptor [Steroidobacteraceae bacterium]|nr:TonB-dependent receptor [Steroidobacteraceae bacterium]